MKKIQIQIFLALFLIFAFPLTTHASDMIAANVGYQSSVSEHWQDFAFGGALSGSENGEALSSVAMHLVDAPYEASIEYRVYSDGVWQAWSKDFEPTAHTTFSGLQIRLVNYPNTEVHYQSYRKGLGWGSWVYNGQTSGNLSNPITGFRVKIFEVGVKYQSDINGSLQVVRHNGETQGTGSIKSLRLGLEQALGNTNLLYRVYFQNQGWSTWVKNWETLSSNNKIEAIEAKIEGNDNYHVAVQVEVQDSGWWDWVYDGTTAGAPGSNQAITAYRVKLLRNAPTALVSIGSDFEGIGENPDTTSLTYSAGAHAVIASYYVTARSEKGYPALTVDGVFDDNPAGVYIAADDQFTASLIDFTVGDEIAVPDTFYGWGNNVVDDQQFEVYYGSYNSTTHVFTVLSTPFELYAGYEPTLGETHTLILYDNDTEEYSNMILDGFALSGVFYESYWSVTGELGSRKLVYNEAQPN